MIKFILAYIATLVVFLALDAIWLGRMGEIMYKPTLGDILLPAFRPVPALVFYLLYTMGVVVFAIKPAYGDSAWSTALVLGALFGFVAYATYDLSNMATLRNWTLQLTLIDLAWGTFATGLSATMGYVASRTLLGLFKIGP
ncbi:MAG: DUF2177 family protein [Beijerinckiaceae bacterium]|nr:DUF2177 family protein [Beijerinckiaceae bacterium]